MERPHRVAKTPARERLAEPSCKDGGMWVRLSPGQSTTYWILSSDLTGHHWEQENCLDEPVLNFWPTTSWEMSNSSCFKSLKVRVVCSQQQISGMLAFIFCLGSNSFTHSPLDLLHGWLLKSVGNNIPRKCSPFNICSKINCIIFWRDLPITYSWINSSL